MKRKVGQVISIILFLVGLGIFLFPWLNDEYTTYSMNLAGKHFIENAPSRFIDKEETEEKKEVDPLFLEMEKYNQNLVETGQAGLVDPWSYEQTSIDLTKYGYTENVIGVLKIPKLDIIMPIALGATKENMKVGAVHLSQTSLPIGGESSNTVIAGHRGYRGATMFRYLDQLEIGDEVIVQNLWEDLTYKVVEIRIILPSEVSNVLIQPGRDLLTLVTCHPYTKNYQRYVVYCERENS